MTRKKNNEKKCDYFNQFVKNAISDLKTSGICYAYYKEQLEEIKLKTKKELKVTETDFGYSITYKK